MNVDKYRRPESIHINVKHAANTRRIEIRQYEINPADILGRSVVFYGRSGTGKSVLIKDFMHALQHKIEYVYVFCPTNEFNEDYVGIVPDQFIYESFTSQDIKKICDAQKARMRAYNQAHNADVLRSLLAKVIPSTALSRNVEQLRAQCVQHAEEIKTHDLNVNQKLAIKHLNINPNTLVIFDDAITELSTIMKNKKDANSEIIKEFFFRARHIGITHFYALQGAKEFPTALRANTFINVFTQAEAVEMYYSGAIGASKMQIACANAAAQHTFDPDSSNPKLRHRKLIYLANKDAYYFYTAGEHNFRMMNEIIWRYCETVQRKNSDVHTPMLDKFLD